MIIKPTTIAGLFVIQPKKLGDERGFFSETYRQDRLAEAGLNAEWVQENHVFSATRGVLRGMHFQAPPHAQAKLLRVTRGVIFDVVVDIRRASPTYGKHVAIELSAENWKQVYVPEGMAHGYCTLSDDCEVLYKVSHAYAPQAEGGLRWNDPALGIDWPDAGQVRCNARDSAWADLARFISPFL